MSTYPCNSPWLAVCLFVSATRSLSPLLPSLLSASSLLSSPVPLTATGAQRAAAVHDADASAQERTGQRRSRGECGDPPPPPLLLLLLLVVVFILWCRVPLLLFLLPVLVVALVALAPVAVCGATPLLSPLTLWVLFLFNSLLFNSLLFSFAASCPCLCSLLLRIMRCLGCMHGIHQCCCALRPRHELPGEGNCFAKAQPTKLTKSHNISNLNTTTQAHTALTAPFNALRCA